MCCIKPHIVPELQLGSVAIANIPNDMLCKKLTTLFVYSMSLKAKNFWISKQNSVLTSTRILAIFFERFSSCAINHAIGKYDHLI